MTTKRIVLSLIGSALALLGAATPALADSSVQVYGMSPLGAINPGTNVTFATNVSGFSDPTYSVTDAFTGSGATVGTIDKIGNFSWTPTAYDAGRHTITVNVSDVLKHTASTTASILVASNNVILTSLSPGAKVSAGTTITFTLLAPGFTNPSFAVYDATPMTSVNSSNVNSSGAFSWTPTVDDIGTHALSLRASDLYGHEANLSQTFTITKAVATSTTTSTTTSATSPAMSGITGINASTLPSTTTTATPPASANPAATQGTQGSSLYVFTTALAIGSRGTAVNELQKRLIALGYLSGTTTGYYGSATAAAVKKFQTAHGLSAVGTVGPATRAALNAH